MFERIQGWALLPVFVAVIAAVFVVMGQLDRLPGSQLRQLLAEFEAAGYPTTVADLESAYAPVDPQRNGAVPILQAGTKIARTCVPELLGEVDEHHRSQRGVPLPSHLREYVHAQLDRCASELKLLREAAACETFRFPVQCAKGSAAPRSNTSYAVLGVYLLMLDAYAAAERGDAEACYGAVRTALRIASSLDDEPSPNGTEHPGHLRFQVTVRLPHLVSRVSPKPEAAQALADALEAGWDKGLLVDALARLRVFILIDARRIAQGVETDSHLNPQLPLIADLRRITDGIATVKALPASEWLAAEGVGQRGIGMKPQMSSFMRCLVRTRAAAALLRIEAMAQRRGRLPSSLEQVAEAYPQGNLINPYTGKAIRYQAASDGYKIRFQLRGTEAVFTVRHGSRRDAQPDARTSASFPFDGG